MLSCSGFCPSRHSDRGDSRFIRVCQVSYGNGSRSGVHRDGTIVSIHLSRLKATADATAVAVCDIDEDRAHEAAAPWNTLVFTDHEMMFAEMDFDAVFVCFPPFAHTDQELLAAEHGIDLFVEKPLGLEADYAHEIREVVQASGPHLRPRASVYWRHRTRERNRRTGGHHRHDRLRRQHDGLPPSRERVRRPCQRLLGGPGG